MSVILPLCTQVGVDYYALSFVRDADVIYEVKDWLAQQGGHFWRLCACVCMREVDACKDLETHIHPTHTRTTHTIYIYAYAPVMMGDDKSTLPSRVCVAHDHRARWACMVLFPGARIGVLAKIESADSVQNLEAILDAVDGAMVARGDLGAELPVEEVPYWQSRIVQGCRKRGKPVIVATNMLESMISNAAPTRAEVRLA